MSAISHFSIPPFLTALIVSIISLYVFLKNPRSKTHQAFLYFCLSLILWTISIGASYSSQSAENAEKWGRISFLGLAFVPSTNFYFYSVMLGLKNKFWTVGFFTISAILLSIHVESNFIYNGTEQYYWGRVAHAGAYHWMFILFCAVVWAFGIKLVADKMQEKKKAGDFIGYNQTKYIFLGLVGQVLGIIDFLPKYGIKIYPMGYIVAVYWCVIVAFAITRYKMLMDISHITRKVIIGSALMIEAVLFYLTIAYLHSVIPVDESVFLTIVSLTCGFMISPIVRVTKNRIDMEFFPEFFQRKEKLDRLGQEILRCKSKVEFNQIILDNIFNSFKITRSYLFLWNKDKKSFLLQSETVWGTFVIQHKTSELVEDHPIPQYLKTHYYLLHDEVRRDFSPNIDQRALSLAMLEMSVSLCIPVRSEGNLTGIFLFGDKESGLPYGTDDIKSLTTLAGHTAVAAENIDLNKRWNEEATHASQVDKILRTYMSSSVADEVLRHADQEQGWKGEKRHATILMSDLRGFTHLSERYTPEEIVRTLNEYFTEMIEIIMQFGGTVDKFMGDAILAVFGVPKHLPQTERAAVLCALQMNRMLKKLNRRRSADGLFTLQMGIGIAAGDVVAGNIGSNKRMEYTVIGDAVNTASRLQSIATSGKIVVTNKVLDKVEEIVQFAKLTPVMIKGKSQPMEVIEILGPKNSMRNSESNDPDIIDLPLFHQKKAQ